MRDILKLVRLQIVFIVLFIVFKSIRPIILDHTTPEWVKITLLSLPNFFEGVIGTLLLTGIGLYLNSKVLDKQKRLQLNLIYTIAVFLAAVYVITQEFKIHNLGGNNVFDINDVIFSVVGLLTGYITVRQIKPIIYNLDDDT